MPISTIPGHLLGNSQMVPSVAANLGVPIVENSTAISSSYSISTGSNAMSSGPITISDGVVITIPDGSVWTIV
jgi:hypothetical protein